LVIDNCKSDHTNVLCGVLQGSILGPQLFMLYVNDICNVSKLFKFVLFADDTNIFYSHENIEILCNVISQELNRLSTLFAVNNLSLNVIDKTNFMLFSNQKYIKDVTLSINDFSINRVYTTNFLGILMNIGSIGKIIYNS